MSNRGTDPFSAVIGKRAGVASSELLFRSEPDAEANRQGARLIDAVQSEDYALVLDTLSFAPDLIFERPLTRKIAEELCEHASQASRANHVADLRALYSLLALDPSEEKILVTVHESEDYGARELHDHLSELLTEDDFREKTESAVYAYMVRVLIQDLLALDPEERLQHLAGNEIVRLSITPDAADVIAPQLKLEDELSLIFTPGLAEHNPAMLRERLNNIFLDQIASLRVQEDVEALRAL